MAKIEITPEEEKLLKESYENDSLLEVFCESSADGYNCYVKYGELFPNGTFRCPKKIQVSESFAQMIPYISALQRKKKILERIKEEVSFINIFEQENEGIPEWLKHVQAK